MSLRDDDDDDNKMVIDHMEIFVENLDILLSAHNNNCSILMIGQVNDNNIEKMNDTLDST